MSSDIQFNSASYEKLNIVRKLWLQEIVEILSNKLELKTALDIACGGGYFSEVLHQLGLKVKGLDLQKTNIESCNKQFPHIEFGQINLDRPIGDIGEYDLVLMFGILYHLESPLQTIRKLRRSIGKIGVIESRVSPGSEMACYLFKEKTGEAHNKARVVSVPTYPALIRMFNYSGFKYIYRPNRQPDHPQWNNPQNGERHCFIASRTKLEIEDWPLVNVSTFLNKWEAMNVISTY